MHMQAKIKDMTTGRPLPLIISFALPLMVGNIFQQLYTVVDTMVVGKALGVDALAALGASLLYLSGFEQWQCSTSSVPGMGFSGIAAAFLGGLHPLGAILSSFFIQHITIGGAYVDKSMYCAQISDLISAIIIYLCGFVLFMKHVMNKGIAKSEAKAAAKLAAKNEAKGGDK